MRLNNKVIRHPSNELFVLRGKDNEDIAGFPKTADGLRKLTGKHHLHHQ
jgi:hypothetical protein